ncbi:DUF4439 domain-containing protein [Arthrobacter sunyaminii]|uniref:Ferritin-like domain-containing protein n=1 Tax=Arthrobacter sunyaminii TaxID=2816859 RepID=A0A975S7L3_9MICC|nr:DUF4439 domain-containing protein [Arthrobacter sunyaminii]MBO0908317.1 DUF4439 domain-containing protein [Arthrobacter sunyaminii]QWQ37304.1 ferritin-like domain-containing protein [Arthrobacter sunyaminii]
MASSKVVNKPPSRTAPAAGRAGRATAVLGGVRRTTVLLVLAAVVLSFNMVAGNGTSEDRPASFSEVAQTDARATAMELARQARELSDFSSEDSPEAGLSRREAKALADEFSGQADVLAEQSVLLTRTGSLRRGSPPPAVSAAGSVSGADAHPAAAYVQALAASARSSLDAAMRADGGTARLLASTGAAQQVLALRAAEAAGLYAPEEWEPASVVGASSKCTDATTGSDAAGRGSVSTPPSGVASPGAKESPEAAREDQPDAAGALQSAVDTEYGAAYAYEVAMARTSDADSRATLATVREDHLAAGEQGVELLPELCLPALTPAPAYSLPASFGDDPAEALADLEASLPAVYADLAGLGTGSLRGWAIDRLADLSTDLYMEGDSVPASPGLDAGPEGLPRAAGTP